MALETTFLATIGFFVLLAIVIFFSLIIFSRKISQQLRAVSDNYEALKKRESENSSRLESMRKEMDAGSRAISSELKELEEQLLVLVKQRKDEIRALEAQVNRSISGITMAKQYDKKLDQEIAGLESALNRLLKAKSKETSALRDKFQKGLDEVKKKQAMDQKKVDRYMREFESELSRYLKKLAKR